MMKNIQRKIFILIAMAPCLAAASLGAQLGAAMNGGMGMPAPDPSQAMMSNNPTFGQGDAMGTLLEQGFIRDLAINAQAEASLSQLAVTNSSNAYVKSLAKVIIADHQIMDAEVVAAASKLKVKLPKGPSGHLLKQEKKMQAMSGSQFDEAYLKELDHNVTQDGSRAKKEIQSTRSPDIRKLMAEVFIISQARDKVIVDVAKTENLNVK